MSETGCREWKHRWSPDTVERLHRLAVTIVAALTPKES
jgi:hypothetical protein